MCVLLVYTPTLLKVVSHYDFSVLSMSVMGFQKMWMGGWMGGLVKLAPSSFFIIIIIRRCDIGVVLHLLGQFAKNRSRCIFLDGSITPCLLVCDSHTPSSVATSSFFQLVLIRLFAVLLLSTSICYFGGKGSSRIVIIF